MLTATIEYIVNNPDEFINYNKVVSENLQFFQEFVGTDTQIKYRVLNTKGQYLGDIQWLEEWKRFAFKSGHNLRLILSGAHMREIALFILQMDIHRLTIKNKEKEIKNALA